MKKRLRIRAFHQVFVPVLLLVGTLPAHASFPGKNGKIAFVAGPDIYTMSPDGSNVKQLTNLGPDSGAFWESWSPDGKQIVFNEFRPPDFLGQIWLMNADGSNQHLLLAESDFDNERPSFSADGRSVVFSRCRLDFEACALFQIEVDGGGVRAITDFELGIQDYSAQFSPDNSLAFTGVSRGGIICAIYLSSDQPAGLRQLTPAPLSGRHPDWSPDGKEIAFSTHCDNPENKEIWVTNVEGNTVRRLTNNGNDFFGGPNDVHPSWSPQGDAIVFERDLPDSTGIFIIRHDGTGCRKVVSIRRSDGAKARAREVEQRGNGLGKRRVREIEEGGTLPQWGVAPK